MTPDVVTQDGPLVYRLDGPDEVEQLARSLEEAAARVRAWPPAVVEWDVATETVTASTWSGHEYVLERRPVRRAFVLEWPA